MTQRKLKNFAVQRDEIETIQAQLSSCLNFTKESLKTNNQEEILMMKTNIVNQVRELTTPFPPDVLVPNVEADVKIKPQLMSMKSVEPMDKYSHKNHLIHQNAGPLVKVWK